MIYSVLTCLKTKDCIRESETLLHNELLYKSLFTLVFNDIISNIVDNLRRNLKKLWLLTTLVSLENIRFRNFC